MSMLERWLMGNYLRNTKLLASDSPAGEGRQLNTFDSSSLIVKGRRTQRDIHVHFRPHFYYLSSTTEQQEALG